MHISHIQNIWKYIQGLIYSSCLLYSTVQMLHPSEELKWPQGLSPVLRRDVNWSPEKSIEVRTVTLRDALAHFGQLFIIYLTLSFARAWEFPSALVLFDLFSLTWESSSALSLEWKNLALTAINLATVLKILLGSRLSRWLFPCLVALLI